MHRLSRITVTVFPALLTLVLMFHFLMTLAYLTPLNPIKLYFQQANLAYMQPFFLQNWQLFAPNPVRDTRVLMVSCRIRDTDGTMTTTEWSDISTPLREASYDNRLVPADRLERLQTGATRIIFGQDEILVELQEHRSEADDEFNKMIDELAQEDEENRQAAIVVLNRIGSAQCDRLYGEDRTEEVRIRVALLEFPRFSQRHLPNEEGELSYVLFDWAPYERVAPMNISGRG